jgi:hypothetical protein
MESIARPRWCSWPLRQIPPTFLCNQTFSSRWEPYHDNAYLRILDLNANAISLGVVTGSRPDSGSYEIPRAGFEKLRLLLGLMDIREFLDLFRHD